MNNSNDKQSNDSFVIDIRKIQERARQNVEQGAVTQGYRGNKDTILKLLNDALATEIVCVLRYKRHHFMSATVGGIAGYAITAELGKHASEEQAHADAIAERIVQLGGEPDFNPDGVAKRAHAQYVAGKTLREMVQEDLVAERIAIDVYAEIIRYVGDKDATTRRMLEGILEQEEEHADELSDFLRRLDATDKTSR